MASTPILTKQEKKSKKIKKKAKKVKKDKKHEILIKINQFLSKFHVFYKILLILQFLENMIFNFDKIYFMKNHIFQKFKRKNAKKVKKNMKI